MIDDNEIIEKLKKLDIDETESIIFIYLLRIGPSRAGVITSSLNLDRNTAYRTLVKLRNKGLVMTTFSNPPLYFAIQPEEAIRIVLLHLEEDFLTIKKTGYELIEELQKMKRTTEGENNLNIFTLIQGKKNALAKIVKIIKSAKNPLYLITTENEIAKMYHTMVPEEIKRHAKKNKVRMILSGFEQSGEFIDSFSPAELRYGNLPSEGLILLEENRQLIMSGGTNTGKVLDADFVVFYTNNPELLSNVEHLCKNLWDSSKSMKSLIDEIKLE